MDFMGGFQKEGEEGALSMINRKTIDFEPNPRLIGDASIPFPRNQQFAYGEKVWKDLNLMESSRKLASEATQATEDEIEAFHQVAGTSVPSTLSQPQQPVSTLAVGQLKVDATPVDDEARKKLSMR